MLFDCGGRKAAARVNDHVDREFADCGKVTRMRGIIPASCRPARSGLRDRIRAYLIGRAPPRLPVSQRIRRINRMRPSSPP